MPRTLFTVTLAAFLLMGVVIVVRALQVTRRQIAVERHEAELSGQLVQAAKLASVGELAAGIAHEINNPLAIIAEEAGLLKDSLDPELQGDDEEPPDLAEHLDIIQDAVFRCRDITRKLLSFVRKTEVRLEPVDLNGLLDDVVDGMLSNELSLANVSVVRDYDEVPAIVTDHNQLTQVLVNLVKNAIDAMPTGGLLTVRTQHGETHVTVSIQDDGCGMSPAELEKVFNPFFTTKEPGKGTGLGLSVSLSIIKHFGGEMFVESTPGEGSVFTVKLPYQPKD